MRVEITCEIRIFREYRRGKFDHQDYVVSCFILCFLQEQSQYLRLNILTCIGRCDTLLKRVVLK